MFEQFTDSCRKVMALANQQAQQYHHEYIGTEHILLGLAKVDKGVGFQILHNFAIDVDKIRKEIEKLVKAGHNPVHHLGKLPQTPRAKKVVEWAIDEARVFQHRDVGTEHLLLGLLQVRDGIASQVLNTLGLTYKYAREAVLDLRGGDDGMGEILYEQVSQEANKNQILLLENEKNLTRCPQCGYDGGFHNIFYDLDNKEQAKWILVCPSCRVKLDIGLKCFKIF